MFCYSLISISFLPLNSWMKMRIFLISSMLIRFFLFSCPLSSFKCFFSRFAMYSSRDIISVFSSFSILRFFLELLRFLCSRLYQDFSFEYVIFSSSAYWLFRPFEYCQMYRKYMCISDFAVAVFPKSAD